MFVKYMGMLLVGILNLKGFVNYLIVHLAPMIFFQNGKLPYFYSIISLKTVYLYISIYRSIPVFDSKINSLTIDPVYQSQIIHNL